MRLKIYTTVCVSILLLCLSCKAQKRLNNRQNDVQEEWFVYANYGEVNSWTLHEDKMIFKSPWDTTNPKGIDTVYMYIQKELPVNHIVVRNKRKKEPYAILDIEKTIDGKKIAMTPIVSGNSIQEVIKKFNTEKTPSWIDLRKRYWYSKEVIMSLDTMPGLDEVTPEDMLTALQWREPLANRLQAYLEDTKGARSFMVYRFVEQYRNEQLIELGYNPYKQVIFNLEEQFKDAPEVLKLLKEEIKF
ncbi:hypothetical protein [uncultured Dokdonia sp.]|uniref:hypothetical protein n=1 Tax=uncultured Dokdonia sp. TaxID=575653 RepID=UPI0026087F9D|nr:hypothetical protein [uncultured Dokdonia sp.]